jgi:hypothetical protein
MPLYVTDVLAEFWGIIGVAHAIEFYRRAHGRERLAADLHARLSPTCSAQRCNMRLRPTAWQRLGK